ncbi:MAG TPA: AMP-binding protein, partial [Minicystis sp.]|nr:AMP-binding protein [Minicystis sp.]
MDLDSVLRRARARGEDVVFRERLDPAPARLARLARVALRIHVLDELRIGPSPAVARLVLGAGLSVRTVHAVHALLTPERAALVDAEGARTYAEVDRAINRTAHALRDELGVGRGTSVALAAENSAAYVIAWFALMRLGARAVHASYRSRPAELEYLVDHANVRAMLVSDASIEAARAVARTRPSLTLVAAGRDAGGALRLDDLAARARPT